MNKPALSGRVSRDKVGFDDGSGPVRG